MHQSKKNSYFLKFAQMQWNSRDETNVQIHDVSRVQINVQIHDVSRKACYEYVHLLSIGKWHIRIANN